MLNRRRWPSSASGRRLSSSTCSTTSIDEKFVNAAVFVLAGAVLVFFGSMHGEAVGIAATPTVAVANGFVAVFLYALSRYPALAPALTGSGEIMAATPRNERNRATEPLLLASRALHRGKV
jgi:hypothetical protein